MCFGRPATYEDNIRTDRVKSSRKCSKTLKQDNGVGKHTSSSSTTITPPVEQYKPTDNKNQTPYVIYCGLDNLGFTCYANSCLQALYTTTKLRSYFLRNESIGPFHRCLSRLFEQMQNYSEEKLEHCNRYASIRPREFIRLFREQRPEFSPGEHDAHEFLTILIELIHREANRVKQYINEETKVLEPKSRSAAWTMHCQYVDRSNWSRLFMGQMETILTCIQCGNQSLSWTAFWQLQVDLMHDHDDNDQNVLEHDHILALSECIQLLEHSEVMNGDSTPFCEQCNRSQPSTKKQTICRAPHYLIVHLKRFTDTGHKIHRRVKIDRNMRLCGKQYSLACCVMHRGDTGQTGHYMTLYQERSKIWVLFDDDSIVDHVSHNEAKRMLQNLAYICMYRSVRIAQNLNEDIQQQAQEPPEINEIE